MTPPHPDPLRVAGRGRRSAGGLVRYGENLRSSCTAAATYMARIKNGANPAVMPVEQPPRFELVVNIKTARALGIVVPQSLLLRADEVIP